eukprot:12661679-Prorocentrum_lima.AAC.1
MSAMVCLVQKKDKLRVYEAMRTDMGAQMPKCLHASLHLASAHTGVDIAEHQEVRAVHGVIAITG